MLEMMWDFHESESRRAMNCIYFRRSCVILQRLFGICFSLCNIKAMMTHYNIGTSNIYIHTLHHCTVDNTRHVLSYI